MGSETSKVKASGRSRSNSKNAPSKSGSETSQVNVSGRSRSNSKNAPSRSGSETAPSRSESETTQVNASGQSRSSSKNAPSRSGSETSQVKVTKKKKRPIKKTQDPLVPALIDGKKPEWSGTFAKNFKKNHIDNNRDSKFKSNNHIVDEDDMAGMLRHKKFSKQEGIHTNAQGTKFHLFRSNISIKAKKMEGGKTKEEKDFKPFFTFNSNLEVNHL